MIDIHPPQHAAITRREFVIHLSTVVLGILIAIGLEQTVEYIHHRHQVAELAQEMRVEAQNNLPLIRDSVDRLKVQATYIRSLEDALLAGNLSGDSADVHGVPPNAGSALYVSPSRAAWSAAQSAGLTALLPADQAKVFARLDYNTVEEISADEDLHETLRTLVSQCMRAQYDHANPAVQRISISHRDDLVFQLGQVDGAIRRSIATLALVEGADEAILARVHSLDGMYSFQKAAVQGTHVEAGSATFFGATPTPQTQTIPNQPGGTE
jgi:hypothetical protein